ncbi:MarR family winged helix-turn-helix transcriptional regulator [Jeotgalibacillus haloalkalitolerans]|uniref:MarR family transcriptional regulator n=1 Tax=Jeotgalibacillus haloalkalitolerans TaxID=3104292 RepID=A0ABU5KHR9_9BACL|nr:MarR family transcriptional regulator [Jeotgalibacillus sp. HH7-29]MDZ5710732.1 MarR family transcriptional regulator [Jeotgalibacillus sp. HH7-29]
MNPLTLSNQLCFPFYAISKEIIKRYRPFLAPLNLTYPQYLVMLVLWEKDVVTLKSIGERLQLDSGTLTPLVNKLIHTGYIEKTRNPDDERQLVIRLTESGRQLELKAKDIPAKINEVLGLSAEEYNVYKKMLDELAFKLNLQDDEHC